MSCCLQSLLSTKLITAGAQGRCCSPLAQNSPLFQNSPSPCLSLACLHASLPNWQLICAPACQPHLLALSSGIYIRMLHPFSRVIAIYLGTRDKSRCQRILGCFRTGCCLLLLWTPHVFFSIRLFACNLSHAICPATLPVILNPLKNNVGALHIWNAINAAQLIVKSCLRLSSTFSQLLTTQRWSGGPAELCPMLAWLHPTKWMFLWGY